MSITEFLTARLDEDEAVARDAIDNALVPWDRARQILYRAGWHSERAEAHIERWHPARVLADIAAKRALIADLAMFDKVATEKASSDPATSLTARGIDRGVMHALRTLAQPFAEHVDFDPAWRMA